MSSAPIASADTERQYGVIGQHLVDQLPEGFARALVYSECAPGTASCDVFFEQQGQVRYAFGSSELTDAMYALWTSMRESSPEPWRAAAFMLDGSSGKFRLDLVYADRFVADSNSIERREPHLQQYFGNLPIDYEPV